MLPNGQVPPFVPQSMQPGDQTEPPGGQRQPGPPGDQTPPGNILYDSRFSNLPFFSIGDFCVNIVNLIYVCLKHSLSYSQEINIYLLFTIELFQRTGETKCKAKKEKKRVDR